jgi:mono/diheme cytochrome c family protein
MKLIFAAVILMIATAACADEEPAGNTVPLDGAALFSSLCASCHGVQGIGATTGVAMTDDLVTLRTDDEIASIISNGQNTMPGYPTLGDAEVAAIVEYVRSLDMSR